MITNQDAIRVAKKMTENTWFRGIQYEDFAKTIVYLVRKYGVGGMRDDILGEQIQKCDKVYRDYGWYLMSYEISSFLAGEGEITEEQKNNRLAIKGVLDA